MSRSINVNRSSKPGKVAVAQISQNGAATASRRHLRLLRVYHRSLVSTVAERLTNHCDGGNGSHQC